ncbi:MAG: hypothetical protein AB7F75_08800 [Planctomycetota bacterium]
MAEPRLVSPSPSISDSGQVDDPSDPQDFYVVLRLIDEKGQPINSVDDLIPHEVRRLLEDDPEHFRRIHDDWDECDIILQEVADGMPRVISTGWKDGKLIAWLPGPGTYRVWDPSDDERLLEGRPDLKERMTNLKFYYSDNVLQRRLDLSQSPFVVVKSGDKVHLALKANPTLLYGNIAGGDGTQESDYLVEVESAEGVANHCFGSIYILFFSNPETIKIKVSGQQILPEQKELLVSGMMRQDWHLRPLSEAEVDFVVRLDGVESIPDMAKVSDAADQFIIRLGEFVPVKVEGNSVYFKVPSEGEYTLSTYGRAIQIKGQFLANEGGLQRDEKIMVKSGLEHVLKARRRTARLRIKLIDHTGKSIAQKENGEFDPNLYASVLPLGMPMPDHPSFVLGQGFEGLLVGPWRGLCDLSLPGHGTYIVKARCEGCQDEDIQLDLRDGETKDITITMRPK